MPVSEPVSDAAPPPVRTGAVGGPSLSRRLLGDPLGLAGLSAGAGVAGLRSVRRLDHALRSVQDRGPGPLPAPLPPPPLRHRQSRPRRVLARGRRQPHRPLLRIRRHRPVGAAGADPGPDRRLRAALGRQPLRPAVRHGERLPTRHAGAGRRSPSWAPSSASVLLVIVVTTFPTYARLVRTSTLSLKNAEFVLAERSLGAGTARILLRHILPNVVGPLLILASMDIPVVITLEAGLTFLGLGVPPPAPSWGRILQRRLYLHPRGAVDRGRRRHPPDPRDARLHLPRRVAARHARPAARGEPPVSRRPVTRCWRSATSSVAFRSPAGPVHALRHVYADGARAARSSAWSARAARASRRWRSPSSACCRPMRRSAPARFASRPATCSALPPAGLRDLRGRTVAMVFQDPMTSLNPVLPIGTQMIDIQYRDATCPAPAKRRRALDVLRPGRHPRRPRSGCACYPARILRRHAPAHRHRHGALMSPAS